MNILTVTSLLLISRWVSSATLYCPSTNDLQPGWSSQDVTIQNQGFTIIGNSGGGAASTKASYNLINGFVSYTINLASVNYYVNANIYAIFPSGLGSAGFPYGQSSSAAPYCDGQGGTGNYPWCPELDFIESNGQCAGASTIHAVEGTNSAVCDKSGCQSAYNLPVGATSAIKMNITFDSNGVPSFYLNGVLQSYTSQGPPPSPGTGNALSPYMTGQGAVLYASMWQGWSPTTSTCTTSSQPWGSLSTSSFSISNLQIYGSIVQGPAATVCSGSVTSAPATTKAATTSAPATTAAPATTKAATTAAPATTKAPTTAAPATTKAPATTAAPATTKAATTAAPATTKAPTTAAPATTKAPTTAAPATTKAPTTAAPATTKAPATTAAPVPTTAAPSPSGAPKTYDAQALGSWTPGRSTFYGVGNGGDCGYGNLPTASFDWDLIAAPNQAFFNNGAACGECFEIYCVSTWAATATTPNYCINGKSVIIQVSDYCPSGGTGGWCNGDIVHFDLSTAAFSQIVTPAQIGTVGVIATQYRRTACPAQGNIVINSPGGNSQWYQAWYVTNVADYGGLSAVAAVCAGVTYSFTQSSYNAWIYSSTLPASSTSCAIKLTDSSGKSLTSATGIITSWSFSSLNFGANFANPSGEIYTESENTTPSKPVTTITVAVVVGVVGITLLVFAIWWTLRTKQRRKSSAPYRQDSVAVPASAPTAATELVVAETTEKPQEHFEETRQKLTEAVQAAQEQQQSGQEGIPQGQEGIPQATETTAY